MSINKLVLIDGHALAYRMYFALPLDAFTTKDGEPTNATYGFTRTLMELMFADQPPKYLAVSFDVGRTFRDDMFDAYKGTREKMPDELRLQIDRIREVVRALNIPVMELDGYEADDVLGTIAKQARPLSVPVHIITGDRDLLQLVDENTAIELPPSRYQRQKRIYNEARVIEEYQLTPKQIVDWKALEGDKSDNIPGVAGVGKKTAVRLLNEYKTLDAIYENLEHIQKRWRTKLEAGKDNAYLSYKLATIVTDAPITLDLDACVLADFDAEGAADLFRKLEFRSLTDMLLQHAPSGDVQTEEFPPTETVIVRTEKELKKLVKALNSAEIIAFDVETTGLDKLSAEVVGICLAVDPPTAYYIPVGHIANEAQANSGQMSLFASEPQLAPDQLPLKRVLDAIRPAMTNPKIGKVAHNAKFDYMILKRAGLDVSPITYDTMLAEFLVDPGSKHLGLKDLVRHRLGVEMQNIEELIGKGRKQRPFSEVEIADAAPYGSADADMTLRLMSALQADVKELGLEDLMAFDMQLVPVLAAMEFEGIGLDVKFFLELSERLNSRIGELEKEIFEIVGHPFNINSTRQLSDVLFTELQLPTDRLKKTKSGHYSTASGVLQNLKMADEDGIIKLVLEYREIGKIRSTYVEALPQLVNKQTGRIHTSLKQTGAVTGRLSSNSPNLQNIPIRTELGRQVRKGFVARPGWKFVAADYSQVELRILAHVSQDEALLDAFRNDLDIHRATAASVHDVPLEEVTFEQRRFAKAVNFGLMYGMGAFRLARDSDLTLAEAENFIKTYFERFPGVRAYLDDTKTQAHQDAYVETLMGRRRYFPVFKRGGVRNRQYVAAAEREAINHPIQGTAADIIKIAMIRLHNILNEGGYKTRMLLQVHDELILEAPDDEVEAIKTLLEETMSGAFELDVPLKVEAEVAQNWYDLKG